MIRKSGALDKSSSALTRLKKELGLIDAWKYCNPTLKEFTFIDPTGKGHDSRIDLWLVMYSGAVFYALSHKTSYNTKYRLSLL